MKRSKACRWVRIVALGLVCLGCSSLQAREATPPKNSSKPPLEAVKPSDDSGPAQYVGSETRQTGHADIDKHWETTPHWKTTLDTKDGPVHQGCETGNTIRSGLPGFPCRT